MSRKTQTEVPCIHIPIEDYPYRRPETYLEGEWVFVANVDRVAAVNIDEVKMKWSVVHDRPERSHYSLPRRISAYDFLLRVDEKNVFHLVEYEDGIAIHAHAKYSGQLLWTQTIPVPPPLPWTEPEPAYEGAETEELRSFLLSCDYLALAIQRKSRRREMWTRDNHYPMPPRHSQLEVIRLDTGSGRILWYSCFPEVQIPEYKPFYGYWTINNEVFALDPLTGMSRLVTQCPGEASTPLIMENKIWTGWVLRGQIGIGCFDALTGAIIHCNNWPRKRGHDIYIHGTEHPPILGINDQFVCLLNDDLSPRWEVRVRPWVYGIASCGNGPVFIGTSGNGGLFCSVDRQTGVIINQVGLPNGAPHPVSMPDLGMVASDYGKGLVIGDGLTGEIHTVKRPGGHTIIGSYGNQVIALCSSPSTGLILIDADNLRQKRTNN